MPRMLDLKCRYCTYVGEVYKSLQKSLLNPVLTTFSEALVTALSVHVSSHASGAGLKTHVLYLCKGSDLVVNCRVFFLFTRVS